MPIIKPGQKQQNQQRRIGLSARQQPTRLLSQIGGQTTAVKHEVPASQMRGGGKVREPKSIDAPPESSSDEEKDYRRLQDSDDDDNGSQYVDIKPTTFNSSQQPSSQTRNPRGSAREKPTQSSKGKKAIRNSQSDEPSSSAGSKRAAEEDPAPEVSSHLTDEFGFTGKKTKKTKSNTRRPATYSSSQPKSSQPRLSQKSAFRSSATRPSK
ncbi:uncharacterized protein F4807DRAFT_105987 [Annulohypoxylon truncatum]|uniref:uncharacterized protein n=1 Tax=Annulohypoxylon truncatum TaxID=327061 RepID=UPI002007336D|nr:uncharacterized protein F4807DRAFT_105987 [Annulohypoxylon truncatum]KAI1208980.1 hypothetical protein F4807DRAFT_105987 [Annulohypoxylon truncatum]